VVLDDGVVLPFRDHPSEFRTASTTSVHQEEGTGYIALGGGDGSLGASDTVVLRPCVD